VLRRFLSAAAPLENGRPPLPGYRPVTSWVHYTTSCKHSLVLLKMGEIIARKHVQLIGIINKPLLLHLVGCLYYLKYEEIVSMT
jgi:hypothetical protein